MPSHKTLVRVYFSDTDALGIVYHANYLDFAERARTEMCRTFGLDLTKLAKESKFFVLRSANINYLSPAKLDDLLEVVPEITKIGRSSMEISCFITNAETKQKVCEVITALVFVEMKNGVASPIEIPQEIKSLFNLA
jgi:acyl-CoA thioester hydrolase